MKIVDYGLDLEELISGGKESRNVEFKEGFNWNNPKDPKIREELIKAILAMSNTPTGGIIILGIKTDTKKKTVSATGMPRKDVKSFIKNEEGIKRSVHNYGSQPARFTISQYKSKKDKLFVVFQVSEFEKWPIVCIRNGKTREDSGKRLVLEINTIYVRSKTAPWSSKRAGSQEIEDIIEMAVKKYDFRQRQLGYTRTNKSLRDKFREERALYE